jgi:signal transduction histidine kinase
MARAQTDEGTDQASRLQRSSAEAGGEGSSGALRNAIQAAEHERARWARELHDETLQDLAALRVSLSAALRRSSPEALERAVGDAVVQIGGQIEGLRGLIAELRPAALDEIGLAAALRAMADRSAAAGGISLEMRLTLHRAGRLGSPALETTIYRLVQEALANVVQHAQATEALVEVEEQDGWLSILVRDDGVGFDPDARTEGFGIAGIRERVTLAGGRFELRAAPGEGTSVSADLPLPDAGDGPTSPSRTRRFASG